MSTVLIWPDLPPAGLAGLSDAVLELLPTGTSLSAIGNLDVALTGTPGSLVVVLDGMSGGDALAALAVHLDTDVRDIVAVIDDSWLGSDAADITPALTGGGAVAAVRSKATRRGARCRANVICVPAALLGPPATQRGPLAHVPDVSDVAEAVAFLLDAGNSYLNGQVLHVNGGRHLFSSLSA